jgi:hypothetical protein
MSTPGARVRLVAWGVAGLLGAATVGGIVVSQITAATAGSPAPQPGAAAAYAPDGTGTQPAWGRRAHRLAGVLGRTVHGEFKVKTGTNTYRTFDIQAGKISAINGQQVTVVSDDSYSATYTVASDTRIVKDRKVVKLSDLAVGDTVHVRAVKNADGSLTAKVIRSGALLPRGPRPMQSGGATQGTSA